uniref:MATH domain-containing protein n=1 Tax=Caenorhabditis tropicalis TaxID=1561998 RepID=A0A1I7TGR3_9PELO
MAPVEKKFVLTHIAKDISSLKEEGWRYSKLEKHFGVFWKVKVSRKTDYLSLYLHCLHPKNEGSWSIQVSFNLKLLSVTGKTTDLTSKRRFINKSSSWGWPEFMKWEEMEKDYMIDGDFLASQSSEFKYLFFEYAKEQPEIILNDVDSKDFHYFLECLYGEDSIDEETVAGILKIADICNAKIPLQKCEQFLIRDSGKTFKEKLQLANRFKLDKLKNECLSKINTAAEIRSVLMCNLNGMDPSVVGALLQKTLSLIPFT